MFNKVVADLLTTYLGEYFDNIDRDQVKVSVWNGLVHMRNLKVRQDALRWLDVPICVMMGTIGELVITIPWTRLHSESVVIRIQRAKLILSDKDSAGYSVDQDQREARRRKRCDLAALDAALIGAVHEQEGSISTANSVIPVDAKVPHPTVHGTTLPDSSDTNFAARLKASILNNIRLEVDELLVHYTSCVTGVDNAKEDFSVSAGSSSANEPSQQVPLPLSPCSPISQDGEPAIPQTHHEASLLFQIQEFKTCSCNDRFETAFVSPGARVVRQRISVRGMTTAVRTGAGRETEMPFLKPFDVELELAYQPVYVDTSVPQYIFTVRANTGCSCVVSSEGCRTFYGLAQFLGDVRQRRAFRRLRPAGERPDRNPRGWWRYVLDAIAQQLQLRKNTAPTSSRRRKPFSWLTYATTMRKRYLYMNLFLRSQRLPLRATGWLEPLTVEEHVQLVTLEEELSMDVLKLAKRLALERITIERSEYEKVMREKATSSVAMGARSGDTMAGVEASQQAETEASAPASKGGWFNFLWAALPGATQSTDLHADPTAEDDISDDRRAEIRGLVQLMTADRWTAAQRAVIAKEFGISADETRVVSESTFPASSAMPQGASNSVQSPSPIRGAPTWTLYVHIAALSVEMQNALPSMSPWRTHRNHNNSCSLGSRPPLLPTTDTLARLCVRTLQAGAEWGKAANTTENESSVRPTSLYWGTAQHLSITTTIIEEYAGSWSTSPSRPEHEILSVGTPMTSQNDHQSDALESQVSPADGGGAPHTTSLSASSTDRRAGMDSRYLRRFSPLESCWSVLCDECCRHASMRVVWRTPAPPSSALEVSAQHSLRVGFTPIHVLLDLVALRRFTDFFFRIMWPSPAARSPPEEDVTRLIPSEAAPSSRLDARGEADFTALSILPSPPLSRFEQRCVSDALMRLSVLRRKRGQHLLMDWAVEIDIVQISLFEVSEVQGCQLTLEHLSVRNDPNHHARCMERLKLAMSGGADNPPQCGAAALGAESADWIDYVHMQAGAVRLITFFPTSLRGVRTATEANQWRDSVGALTSVDRRVLLEVTPLTVVAETNLLGHCHPEISPWSVRVASNNAVQLAWSRTSLSVLSTACTLLADWASSVGESLLRRGRAPPNDGCASITFRVKVQSHPTGYEFWHPSGSLSSPTCDPLEPQHHTNSHGEELNAIGSDSREVRVRDDQYLEASVVPVGSSFSVDVPSTEEDVLRRVEVRRGAFIVYHALRPTFPSQYYTLQQGCTRLLRRSETTLEIYVSQGGRDQEETSEDDFKAAKNRLFNLVKMPNELAENAFWLKAAVEAWWQRSKECMKGEVWQDVQRDLTCVLKGLQTVRCRYVGLKCAVAAETDALESTLRRCYVDAGAPPLLLSPVVQARFGAATAEAPELSLRPVFSFSLSLPSLCILCEGQEPAVSVECGVPEAKTSLVVRPDATLTFTPFCLDWHVFSDHDCYELRVARTVELRTRCLHDTTAADTEASTLLRVMQSACQCRVTENADTPPVLHARLVNHRHPWPLPPAPRATATISPSAHVKMCVCPALLECAETMWDAAALLSNQLFRNEVIVGYPWWPTSTAAVTDSNWRQDDSYSAVPRSVEAEWSSIPDYGGNTLRASVDITLPALAVDVSVSRTAKEMDSLPGTTKETVSLTTEQERASPPSDTPVLHFNAQAVSCQWRWTASCNAVKIRMRSPEMRYKHDATVAEARKEEQGALFLQPQTHLMANALESTSCCDVTGELTLDWKSHKAPPMLSLSDWLYGSREQPPTGFRDQREVKLTLRQLRLLYWHPLLMHLLHTIHDGLASRATAIGEREPCLFRGGLLFCPPLSWPPPHSQQRHRGGTSANVMWSYLRKAITFEGMILEFPEDLSWFQKVLEGGPCLSPDIRLSISTDLIHFRDRLGREPLPSVTCDCAASMTVEQVYAVSVIGMSVEQGSSSAIDGCESDGALELHWKMPSWNFTISQPFFQARSIGIAGNPWRKSFNLVLPSVSELSVLRGMCADLAFIMNVVQTSFLHPSTSAIGTAEQGRRTSPASLLREVVEVMEWNLDVKGTVVLSVNMPSSRSLERSTSGALLLSGARVFVRCADGRVLYGHLETERLYLGSREPSSGAPMELQESGLFLVAPAEDKGVASPRPSLSLRYASSSAEGHPTNLHTAFSKRAPPVTTNSVELSSLSNISVGVDTAALADCRHIFFSLNSMRKKATRHNVDSAAHTEVGVAAVTDVVSASPAIAFTQLEFRCQLKHLQCQLPCSSAALLTQAPSRYLCLTVSCFDMEWKKMQDKFSWRLRVGRLMRGALVMREGVEKPKKCIPVLLEQPEGWQRKLSTLPSSPPMQLARLSADVVTALEIQPSEEVPRLARASSLDELFADFPDALTEGSEIPFIVHPTSLSSPDSATASTKDFLFLSIECSPAVLKVDAQLQPLWFVAPSADVSSAIADGFHRLRFSSAVWPAADERSAIVPPSSTESALGLSQPYQVAIECGTITFLTMPQEPRSCSDPDSPAAIEREVQEYLRSCDALLLSTESVKVMWDSTEEAKQLPEKAFSAPGADCLRTVLHLRDTTIRVVHHLESCTVVMKDFSVRVTKQLVSTHSTAAPPLPTVDPVRQDFGEEWRVSVDPLHLTLSQSHYTALLRLALVQASMVKALISSAAAASRAWVRAPVDVDVVPIKLGTRSEQRQPPNAFRVGWMRYRFHAKALCLWVHAEGAEEYATSAAAYVDLAELDVTYVREGERSRKDAHYSCDAPVRLLVSLTRCCLGVDGAVPAFSITAAAPDATTSPRNSSCVLEVRQQRSTEAFEADLHVGKVNLTIETVPVMVWIDRFYVPYLQLSLPHYQSVREHVLEGDLSLSEDLELTVQTPLRVRNTQFSLLFLDGRGHSIHFKGNSGSPLILVDEGVTLRILHASLHMDGDAVESYVVAGNGSYVVIDRETCSVRRPSSLSSEWEGTANTKQPDSSLPAATTPTVEVPGGAGAFAHGLHWHRFFGEVQVQLRLPEPRRPSNPSSPSSLDATGTGDETAQRTLVLCSHMTLCLLNSENPKGGADNITAAFDLAHASARTEYVTPRGAARHPSTLVADWHLKVLTTEEMKAGSPMVPHTHASGVRPSMRTRKVQLSSATGVAVRLRYSDMVFVLNALQHAQEALARWHGALQRDIWTQFSSLNRRRDTLGTVGPSGSPLGLPATLTCTGSDGATRGVVEDTVVSVLIPYLSIYAVDDSLSTEVPLFCVYLNNIQTPRCVLASPRVNLEELHATIQIDHYDLSKSLWTPVLDPLEVFVSVDYFQNQSVADVFERKGFFRMAARADSAKIYFTLGLLRNLRQLQRLKEMVGLRKRETVVKRDGAGVDGSRTDALVIATSDMSSFRAFKIVQATGVDLAVQLPEYAEHPQHCEEAADKDTPSGLHAIAESAGNTIQSGQSWAFNFPQCLGKELAPNHQKVVLRMHAPNEGKTSEASPPGAVVSVASVGLQRVSMGLHGPFSRHLLADISVPVQQQGQKQILLRSNVTLHNRLRVPILQLIPNNTNTFETIHEVQPDSIYRIPILLLHRRVHLALGKASGASVQYARFMHAAVSPESVASLGISYNSLPSLTGAVILCVCAPLPDSVSCGCGEAKVMTKASSPKRPSSLTRLAAGENCEVVAGSFEKLHYVLRVQACEIQPSDVLRHHLALSPLQDVTVTAEACIAIRNAVGVPLTLHLYTRRIHRGNRVGFLDATPDVVTYTQVHSVVVPTSEVCGVTEMDPLEEVFLSVSLQQPNGSLLTQSWPTSPGTIPTIFHSPVCIYAPSEKTRCDTQIVLADPASKATLVLALHYNPQEVTLYCPYWIINEAEVPLQLADTAPTHHGDTERCGAPLAGLSGSTVATATVAPWCTGGDRPAAASTHSFLYNSLRSAAYRRKDGNAGSSGLYLRIWETVGARGSDAKSGWTEWSSQPLIIHEAAEEQVVVCASRLRRGTTWVLSCCVELGHQTSLNAYSDTRVVAIRPRWVILNKTPYHLLLTEHHRRSERGAGQPTVSSIPFSTTVWRTRTGDSLTAGKLHATFSLKMENNTAAAILDSAWTSPFSLDAVTEVYVNVVYRALVPLADHWPQLDAATGHQSMPQKFPDYLPPLHPEDIQEVQGILYVRREETKVFCVTTYSLKGCMVCAEIAEAAQPPLVLENRTPFTLSFCQQGMRRGSVVFPRRRKAWAWDVSSSTTPVQPVMVLQVVHTNPSDSLTGAAERLLPGSCVLNMDPRQVGQRSNASETLRGELEVRDVSTGTSTMLFVRVRGLQGLSYAISITTEPTIDAFLTLPFPQLSYTANVNSLYVLCRSDGEREDQPQDMLLFTVEPLSFSFTQGIHSLPQNTRISSLGQKTADEVQRLQLRFRTVQIDDERPSAKERVAMQLVDHKESGFHAERKMLRTSPILFCSSVEVRLCPVEMHVADGFITAMMHYSSDVQAIWCSMVSPNEAAAEMQRTDSPPWRRELAQQAKMGRRNFTDAQHSGTASSQMSSVPLWRRVVAIQHLCIDPLLVSLTLNRSPGATDDPLWKLAGAASLLIRSTQDARLHWDAVDRRDVYDTIWHLAFLHQESFKAQMRSQYMSLVSIMGFDTVRNFVSDLLGGQGNATGDRVAGDAAMRRQKPRLPRRRAAGLCIDKSAGTVLNPMRVAHPSERQAPLTSDGSTTDRNGVVGATEPESATTVWLLRVPLRKVPIKAQRTISVFELARAYPLDTFLSIADLTELKAFGGFALGRDIAAMRATPRYTLRRGQGDGPQRRAAEVVSYSGSSRPKTSRWLSRVNCERCVELEALRESRLRNHALTPLPHPIRDGFITWEEFAHHIDWYEFVDMCTDEEVRTYAELVCQGASEASANICVLTSL